MASFQAQRIPAILAINKIDTLDLREKLMPRILAFSQAHPFEAVVPISALKGDGVDAVLFNINELLFLTLVHPLNSHCHTMGNLVIHVFKQLFPYMQGESEMLGQGPGGLAQPGKCDPLIRIQLSLST